MIRLYAGEREGTLIVRDDGIGIAKSVGRHTGVGMHIMNYRAGMIGGRLEVQPQSATRHDRDLPVPYRDARRRREDGPMTTIPPASKKKRVFVVDDHPIVRQGLALLINREPDLTVCGEAEDARTAMQSIITANPDILIVDISLNGPDGLDLLKEFVRDIRTCRC